MRRRAEALRERFPERANDLEWIADQCRSAALGGFFDDTMSGALVVLLDLCVRSKLMVAEDIEAAVSYHKVFVGTHDG